MPPARQQIHPKRLGEALHRGAAGRVYIIVSYFLNFAVGHFVFSVASTFHALCAGTPGSFWHFSVFYS